MKKVSYFLIVFLLVIFLGQVWADTGATSSHGFLYKPPLGARGQTEKNLFDAGLDRVDIRLGKEIWAGDPAIAAALGSPIEYASALTAALTTLGSTPCTLHIPRGTYTIPSDQAILANVNLKPERGAVFAVATGKTLTIKGTIEAGNYQIFSCTGTGRVYFNNGSGSGFPEGKRLNAIWWGADPSGVADSAPAFNKMFDSVRPVVGTAIAEPKANFYLPAGKYLIRTTLNATNLYYWGMSGDESYAAMLYFQTNGTPGLDLSGAGYFNLANIRFFGAETNPPNVLVLQRRSVVGGTTHIEGGSGVIKDCFFDGWFTKFALVNISQESNSIFRSKFYCQGGNPKAMTYITGYDQESLTSPYQTNEDLGLLGMWFKECNINAGGGVCPAMYFTGGFGLVSVRDSFLSAYGNDSVVKFYKPTACDAAGKTGYGVTFEDTLCEGNVTKGTYYVAFENAAADTLGVNGITVKKSNANLQRPSDGALMPGFLFEGGGVAQAINFDIEDLVPNPGGQAVKIDGQLTASRILQRVYASGGYGNQHVGLQVTSYSERNFIHMGPGASLSLMGPQYNNTVIQQRAYGVGEDPALAVDKLLVNGGAIYVANGKPTIGDWQKGSLILNQNNYAYTDSDPVIGGWMCTGKGTLGTLNSGGTMGTITNGTNALTVNDITGLYVGNWIDIATVSNGTFLVTHVDEAGKIAYLDHNVGSGAITQAVSFHAPLLRAMNTGGWVYSSNRPALTGDDAGYMVWDVNLGKIIVWNGSAWKLADGGTP
ncbi:MAG: hypothetical protein NTY36_16215 [Deltaproteobacteria bacterium]|nr:hypothetical protein [Deltaproteobacteria bacterium]